VQRGCRVVNTAELIRTYNRLKVKSILEGTINSNLYATIYKTNDDKNNNEGRDVCYWSEVAGPTDAKYAAAVIAIENCNGTGTSN